MKKLAGTLGALILSIGVAAHAHTEKSDKLVIQRQAAFTLIGKYFGVLSGMVKGKIPYDQATAQQSAALLEALAQMPWDGFQPSTLEAKNTEAKPEIYKDKTKFDGFAKDLQAATTKLAAASKSGGLEALKPALADVGKACKACHESFKVD